MACEDLDRLCTTADIIAAMSVEALLGTDQAFLPELQATCGPIRARRPAPPTAPGVAEGRR